jgi:hypothetical protein
MADYYRNHPISALNVDEENNGENNATELSYFDKHRRTLLMDNTKGWASELRRYLDTMQCDVKKDTDLVECIKFLLYLCIELTNNE